jgi:hypothetical protein
MKNKKHILSLCCLSVFIFLALASRVNKLHYGAFYYGNRVEDPADTRNYIQMNDGKKIYGEKISWKAGLLVKDQIKIDDDKYKILDVRGYQDKQIYYGRLKKEYIQRIVHGKINVYVQFTQVTQTSTDHGGFSHTSTYTRTDHYAQRGETGPMVGFASQKDMKELVAGCPLAEEMCDKSNHQIRKAIRNNHTYLNDIFETYNNGCKPLTKDK